MTSSAQNHSPGLSNAWRRACVACTKSKRRCTKQTPACRRCRLRDLSCVYLPPRLPASPEVALHLDASSLETLEHVDAIVSCQPPVPSDNALVPRQPPVSSKASTQVGHALTRTAAAQATNIHLIKDAWFLSPDSFIEDHSIPQPNAAPMADSHLKYFIGCVQRWLGDWITEGQSPLHHPRLYRLGMPRHVQDAYTAVALYMARNPKTEDVSFQVISDRAAQLVDDQALQDVVCDSRDLFGHLGRVQGLLTYQVIRLFDGNIRMRAQADSQVALLFEWTRDMMEATRQCVTQGLPTCHHVASDASTAVWDTWILVESIRRTWLLANYVQQVYLYWKLGWSECPGRVLFTMRSGLWDAPSALEWETMYREQGPLFVPIADDEMLFAKARSDEVDAFGHAIVAIEHGLDKFGRWVG